MMDSRRVRPRARSAHKMLRGSGCANGLASVVGCAPALGMGTAVLLTMVASGVCAVRAGVVINEIHYDPVPKNDPVEFVELHNPDAMAVAVGGWRLGGAVALEIPAGTTLGAGGYLVLGQDAVALRRRFGVAAVGGWSGRLSARGERVTLRDTQGRLVDEVDYDLGFPWPTVGDAPGYSIELVNPAEDNDLGGSWRPSRSGASGGQDRQLIGAGSVWKLLRGRGEASTPQALWRLRGFDDAAWESGALPAGYGEGFVATALNDMRNGYSSVFLRREFQVDDPATVGGLVLEALFDDGFNAWINGRHVLGQNVPAPEMAFDGTAVSALESLEYHAFPLPPPAAYLVAGANVIAVQGFNSSVGGSSDFFMDFRLRATAAGLGAGPTPGRRNAAYAEAAPPQIRQVSHRPQSPRGGEAVVITAKATSRFGMGAVRLEYQVVEPGVYVELTDPAYAQGWIAVALNDGGRDGDERAGDGVYAATLPAQVQRHRRLVRYRILAADAAGREVQAPYVDDPAPNFAYFVYDGVPGWRGSARPGVAPAVEFPAAEMGRLPVYHLISKRDSVERSTWIEKYGGDQYKWRGTLVYDGEVYDHIRYRARGGVWRYAMGKNMWKFDFNRGRDFEARDDFGRAYRTGWTKLNLGACIQQGDYHHRGEQGLFEASGFALFNLAGVESPRTHWVQLRVIDEATEASATDQFRGDFWGLYLAIEQEDGRFLAEHGLPDGNLYKMEGGTGELNNLGDTGVADKSDLNRFLSAYRGSAPSLAWWRANLDLERYYSYQAIVQGIHHYDICYGKNYFYYLNPVSGRWSVHSWDLDLTWADNMYDAGCGGRDDLRARILARPELAVEYRNRVREIRDLLFNPDQGFQVIDAYAGVVMGAGGPASILEADRAMWDYHPVMGDSSRVNPSKAGWGRFYQFPRESATNSALRGSFEATVRIMKNYVMRRAGFLDAEAADPDIPGTPRVRSTGPAGFPLNRIVLRLEPYTGRNAFAALEWRLGEVEPAGSAASAGSSPRHYEIDAVWHSGPLTLFEPEVRVPAAALQVGRTYRARARFADTTGRKSHWSAPLEFMAGAPDNAQLLADHLRVSELMYAPAGGDAFEFIEFHNTSAEHGLELDGVRISRGVDFLLPTGTRLAPGEYVLLTRAGTESERAAFRAHYGVGGEVQLLGPFARSLADGGESIVIEGPGGALELIAFEYGDGRGWPVAADGAGHSLVPLATAMAGQGRGSLSHPRSWRASAWRFGSPGGADPEPQAAEVVLNEVVTHTDLFNEWDSNDWIELYNRGAQSFRFGTGWYLSDSAADLTKWAVPAGVVIAPRAWIAFDEVTGFHRSPDSGFGLSKSGEELFLSHLPAGAKGAVVDALRFKGQDNGRAFGRYPDGADDWYDLPRRTQAAANAAPQPGVVISEIMYHPPSVAGGSGESKQEEFVEIWNSGVERVRLEGWRLSGDVDFAFPAGLELAAGAVAIVAGFNPADAAALASFRARYGLGPSGLVSGGFSGDLANGSGRLTLERPLAPEAAGGAVVWVVVDELIYLDTQPWPITADGGGHSLHRLAALGSGFAAGSWGGAAPTPGRHGEASGAEDSDRDGMPDSWEMLHGLNPALASDALEDADGDGRNNLEEYRSGTDPRDAGSVLRLEAWTLAPEGLRLRFRAAPQRGYRIESAERLGTAEWVEAARFEAAPSGRSIDWTDARPDGANARFYRVVTP